MIQELHSCVIIKIRFFFLKEDVVKLWSKMFLNPLLIGTSTHEDLQDVDLPGRVVNGK